MVYTRSTLLVSDSVCALLQSTPRQFSRFFFLNFVVVIVYSYSLLVLCFMDVVGAKIVAFVYMLCAQLMSYGV